MSFATLKDYGVEKVFELENENTDSSQRNIVYIVHGEKAAVVQAVAREFNHLSSLLGHTRRLRGISLPLLAISLAP